MSGDEVYVVVRNYSWSGYEIVSVWSRAWSAAKERDRLNEGELPEPEDSQFGDQTELRHRVFIYELDKSAGVAGTMNLPDRRSRE